MKKQIILKLVLTTVYFGFILILTFVTPATRTIASSLTAEGKKALQLVNKAREANGLNDLGWNEKLSNAANLKAKDIVSKNYFDHVSPDGKKAWDFILNSGYDYRFAGENLAIDFSNVDEAEKAWEKSPTHLRNIISPKYSDFGFASLDGQVDGHQTKVFVQLFAEDNSLHERAMR